MSRAPPPPSGLTYMGWKIMKKYYPNHRVPKKILVPRPQKWGLKMGHFSNLFSKCDKKCHKTVIFKDNFSIFHFRKLCSKTFVIYADKNFRTCYTIPNPKTQKPHFEFSWKKIKCRYVYIFTYPESKTKMLYFVGVCHQKKFYFEQKFWHPTFPNMVHLKFY